MNLKQVILSFPGVKLKTRDGHKLRGYISEKFPKYQELHNHGEGGFIYRYPLVQYKVINSTPMIVGIDLGADRILEIEDEIDFILLEEKKFVLYEKKIECFNVPLGLTDIFYEYSFCTPWMALNQTNYERFDRVNVVEKRELLKSILVGNLLSLSKSLNYQVEGQIAVDFGMIEKSEIKYKNKFFAGFKGSFFVNFNIPEYLGLGKSVSRGFGTVCRCK